MQLNRDYVRRLVVDAFIDRGLKPRAGAKVDVLLGDYAMGLEGIPEKPLEQAMRDVIRDWTFPGWPSVGDIRKAAARYTALPGEDAERADGVDPEQSRRNKAACDYARARMLANNGELLMRLLLLGPWTKQQIEKFLVAEAIKQLRAGALDAHVRNDTLEAEIASLASEQDARTRSQAAVMAKGPGARKVPAHFGKEPIEQSQASKEKVA